MKTCPKCDREWPEDCEQSISIERYGECVVCKFSPMGDGSNNGTAEELASVSAESIMRRTIADA